MLSKLAELSFWGSYFSVMSGVFLPLTMKVVVDYWRRRSRLPFVLAVLTLAMASVSLYATITGGGQVSTVVWKSMALCGAVQLFLVTGYRLLPKTGISGQPSA